jgi:hypothetical protein
MNRAFLLITFLFIGISSIISQVIKSNLVDVDSKLKFSNSNYNMGKIPFGKPLEYKVTIENVSNDSLTLKSVSPQCGCTSPKYLSNEILYPGSKTQIILGFNGNTKGRFSKTVTVYFSDNLSKVLKFSGETILQ